MHFARVLLAACAVFSTVSAANYSIMVGTPENATTGSKPSFTPHYISVRNGDYFTFDFTSAGTPHRIFRSLLDPPCKADKINGSKLPINRTLTFLANNTIKTDSPVFYFCEVGNHCYDGMVFGINLGPSPDEVYQDFKAKAAASSPTPKPYPSSGVKMFMLSMPRLAGVVLLIGLLV